MCGIHIFRACESFIQEVPLLPVSDVVEKVVMGMGCLFQAFLSFGSVGGKMGEAVRIWRAEETDVCASDYPFPCPSS